MRKILGFIKNTEGQALVESALVLSFVLIPLVLGMIEFGWILDRQIILTNAAREGARVAAISKDYGTASVAVSNALSGSGITLTEPKSIIITSENATVTLDATMTPIVGIVSNPFHLTAKSVMKSEN